MQSEPGFRHIPPDLTYDKPCWAEQLQSAVSPPLIVPSALFPMTAARKKRRKKKTKQKKKCCLSVLPGLDHLIHLLLQVYPLIPLSLQLLTQRVHIGLFPQLPQLLLWMTQHKPRSSSCQILVMQCNQKSSACTFWVMRMHLIRVQEISLFRVNLIYKNKLIHQSINQNLKWFILLQFALFLHLFPTPSTLSVSSWHQVVSGIRAF